MTLVVDESGYQNSRVLNAKLAYRVYGGIKASLDEETFAFEVVTNPTYLSPTCGDPRLFTLHFSRSFDKTAKRKRGTADKPHNLPVYELLSCFSHMPIFVEEWASLRTCMFRRLTAGFY